MTGIAQGFERMRKDSPGPLWMVYREPKERMYVVLVWFVHAKSKAAAVREAQHLLPSDFLHNGGRDGLYKPPSAILVTQSGEPYRL